MAKPTCVVDGPGGVGARRALCALEIEIVRRNERCRREAQGILGAFGPVDPPR